MLVVLTLFYEYTITMMTLLVFMTKSKYLRNLVDEYDINNKCWDPIPTVQLFETSKYEASDNVIAIAFSD